MSFIFTVQNGRRMRSNSRDQGSIRSLPAISEVDSDHRLSHPPSTYIRLPDAPPAPPRAINRPPATRFALGTPPRYHNKSPRLPPYGAYMGTESADEEPFDGERGEKLAGLRKCMANNKHIAKRGGWKRVAIITIIIALCIVGLIVGLVIALRKKSQKSNQTGGSTIPGGGTTSPASNATFPAGSYSIDTYLSSISTNCTSNPATWTCYPYSTYSQNPSASNTTFYWVITPVEGAADNYIISSTANYFSMMFTNASLSLQSAGNADEHYYFQTTMQKTTKPSSQLGDQNVVATCYFNQTVLEGFLYTKMAKTYPSVENATDISENQVFGAWPFAVDIQQGATSESGSPTCLDPSGNSLGTFSVQQDGESCQCAYLNTRT